VGHTGTNFAFCPSAKVIIVSKCVKDVFYIKGTFSDVLAASLQQYNLPIFSKTGISTRPKSVPLCPIAGTMTTYS
jgi:hypothetical protein